MALWAGFLVVLAEEVFGLPAIPATATGPSFGDMRARYGAPEVALIPIGAYEPRWFMAAQHVDPQAAVRVFRDIGARRALGSTGGLSG